MAKHYITIAYDHDDATPSRVIADALAEAVAQAGGRSVSGTVGGRHPWPTTPDEAKALADRERAAGRVDVADALEHHASQHAAITEELAHAADKATQGHYKCEAGRPVHEHTGVLLDDLEEHRKMHARTATEARAILAYWKDKPREAFSAMSALFPEVGTKDRRNPASETGSR